VPLLAPSPVADPLFREVPRQATDADLAAVVAAFAAAAARCRAGGLDGVELQASQSSMLRAFLSPTANRRTDRWGGPVGQRARLLLEVVHAVRDALGPDLLLGVRLAAAEPDGTTTGDAVTTARLLADTGAVATERSSGAGRPSVRSTRRISTGATASFAGAIARIAERTVRSMRCTSGISACQQVSTRSA